MKSAKLKLVETPKNTELLDNVIQVYNQTANRLGDTKNSVKVIRTVTPKEENFQKVKTALNAMLDVNMKKQRGSLNLIETSQEVILVPENDEESAKVQVLVDALSPALSSNLNIRNLDRVALDKVFSNLSWVQTNEFSDEVEVSSTDMNFMNTFVTSSSLMNLTGGRTGHPRALTVINDAYENLFIVNYLREHNGFRLNKGNCFNVLCSGGNENSVELGERVTSALNEMKVVNEKLDAYISEVSIPASEFFALLPDETNTELNELVEIAKQKELRDSQLVRKTVNVGLTLNLEVELDSLGDIEDIKKIISERVQNHLVGHSLNCGLDYYYSDGDHLEVKETTFAGVDVISNLDEVA
jgi:hypothetical protein